MRGVRDRPRLGRVRVPNLEETVPTLRPLDWVVAWGVRSQDGARRNAQRAAIADTQRRRERETVERFLATLDRPSVPGQRRPARG